MALKSPGSGQRARANPTEALIPDHLHHYRDPYDSRWRGDKPYIGLGNEVRDKINQDLWTSVRWMLPGDLLDWSGLLRWADAHFPGYDPDLDHGVYEEVGDAIGYLIKHGFLQRCNQENSDYIRTDKPPEHRATQAGLPGEQQYLGAGAPEAPGEQRTKPPRVCTATAARG